MMHIAVLGGGISGITTALLLQARGHATTLVTAARADQAYGADWPRLASHYPAASVIPHSVRIDEPARHTRWSQACFDVFADHSGWGVRIQRHAELFEAPPEQPAYLDALRGLTHLPNDGRGAPGLPRRPGAEAIFGWTFDMTFVEAPRYLQRLYRCYQRAGGSIERKHITPENRTTLPGDVWINCLGAGAPHVFADPAPATYRHGHLLHVAPPVPNTWMNAAAVQSYNYAPAFDCYPTPENSPGGLYFYPRSSVWIVGGTKHPAHRTGGYRTPLRSPTVRVQGVTLPRAMWITNAHLIRQLTGADLHTASMRVVSGLRYLRDPAGKGVRLSWDASPERPTIHNYGHGGAGVTLSWSCALLVAHTLEQHVTPTQSPPGHGLLPALRATVTRLLDAASLTKPLPDRSPTRSAFNDALLKSNSND